MTIFGSTDRISSAVIGAERMLTTRPAASQRLWRTAILSHSVLLEFGYNGAGSFPQQASDFLRPQIIGLSCPSARSRSAARSGAVTTTTWQIDLKTQAAEIDAGF